MGDVESVLAKSTTSLVDIEAEDTGIAKTATKKKYPEEPTSIIGEQATVKIGEFALN